MQLKVVISELAIKKKIKKKVDARPAKYIFQNKNYYPPQSYMFAILLVALYYRFQVQKKGKKEEGLKSSDSIGIIRES